MNTEKEPPGFNGWVQPMHCKRATTSITAGMRDAFRYREDKKLIKIVNVDPIVKVKR
jgi:N-acetyl-beta-hexosaminidase